MQAIYLRSVRVLQISVAALAVFALALVVHLNNYNVRLSKNVDNPLDSQIANFLSNTERAAGRKIGAIVLHEAHPLVLAALGLPKHTEPFEAESIIQERLNQAKSKGLSPTDEAKMVLNANSLSTHSLNQRIKLLDLFMHLQSLNDPRHGSSCYLDEWVSPFRYLDR